jgi:hypothetical protein
MPDFVNFPSGIAAIIIGWHLLASFIALNRYYKSLFGSADRSEHRMTAQTIRSTTRRMAGMMSGNRLETA